MVRLRHVDPRMFFYSKNPCRILWEFRLDAESGALKGALYETVILNVPFFLFTLLLFLFYFILNSLFRVIPGLTPW